MWFIAALLSGLCFGTTDLLSRYVLQHGVSHFVLFIIVGILYGSISLILLLFYLKKNNVKLNLESLNKNLLKNTDIKLPLFIIICLVIAIIFVPADVLFNYSLKNTKNAGYVASINSITAIVFVYLFSILVFKESTNPFALLGVLLIIIGAGLINIFGS